jgi:ribosomal protein S18 acetylase RimI-like enzyme
MIRIRLLTPDDLDAFRTIRLRALQEHPEAFGSGYEDEIVLTTEQWQQRLATDSQVNPIFGAFMDGVLVGIGNLSREVRGKRRHRASVNAVYVAYEARGQGIGRVLMEAIIAHARSLQGLQDVTLYVAVGNQAALDLYLKLGFVQYGRDLRYIYTGGRYYDMDMMMLRLTGDE